MTLTLEHLRSVLGYDPLSGIFTFRHRAGVPAFWNALHAGKEAGSIDHHGYRIIGFDRKDYSAHRLAWLYVHECYPSSPVDHIDRNRSNNAIANLRLVTPRQNRINCSASGSSRYLGVTWHAQCGKWQASIDGTYLGVFGSEEAAAAAYNAAAIARYGEYAACLSGASS